MTGDMMSRLMNRISTQSLFTTQSWRQSGISVKTALSASQFPRTVEGREPFTSGMIRTPRSGHGCAERRIGPKGWQHIAVGERSEPTENRARQRAPNGVTATRGDFEDERDRYGACEVQLRGQLRSQVQLWERGWWEGSARLRFHGKRTPNWG